MASLSSFLLKDRKFGERKTKEVRIDKNLDTIFQSNKGAGPSQLLSAVNYTHPKRKFDTTATQASSTKKVKHDKQAMVGSADSDQARLKGRGRQQTEGRDSESSSDEAGSSGRASAERSPGHQDSDVSGGSDDDSQGDPSRLVHESLRGGKNRTLDIRQKKSKYALPDETLEVKDQRTIFVGNVPADVAKRRGLMKQLRRHLLSFVPTAKIESTRCRSVAFQVPTAKLPVSDDEEQAGSKGKDKGKAKKQPRQHEAKRASSWRDTKASKEDAELTKDEKKYLTPQDKKKIAFIHHELHPDVDTVNVYVVFAHPVPGPKAAETMDPFEAARLSVERSNGSIFSDHTLRVDSVGKAKAIRPAGGAAEDLKSTIFVGNIDFACKEEDLRAFFEALMTTERGVPTSDLHGGDDDGEQAARPKTWVTRVRIIRDRDTQLGKGFAYVQFLDRDCADEVLGLEESKLKFAKRKLRVQRCKSTTGNATPVKTGRLERSGERSRAPRIEAKRPVDLVSAIPKGNPALGEKIAHLPKEARKQAKASDSDRVARRLAKKKARIALVQGGVKAQVTERERMRKRPRAKLGSAPGKESKRKRVRSDKSVFEKNTKK